MRVLAALAEGTDGHFMEQRFGSFNERNASVSYALELPRIGASERESLIKNELNRKVVHHRSLPPGSLPPDRRTPVSRGRVCSVCTNAQKKRPKKESSGGTVCGVFG